MKGLIFYNAGTAKSTEYAEKILAADGYTFSNTWEDSTHILLDTPCNENTLPAYIPEGCTLIGGNLPKHISPSIDLLQDPRYLAENANITAHCAIRLATEHLPITLEGCQVLVIGWGRIGKCLAKLLLHLGAKVKVAARKESDRALLTVLGYDAIDIPEIPKQICRVVFNTVPTPVANVQDFSADSLIIELASSPGIQGGSVVDGRRLPGRYAPESSGALIARSILRLLPEVVE